MTRIRRTLVLTGLTLAAAIGVAVPASATFADSAARTTSIGTVTVAAPTQVEAIPTCTTTVDPVSGATTTTVQAKIEWWRSATRGVSGYRIIAHLTDGTSRVLAETGAGADQFLASSTTDPYLAQRPRFTVTTLTSYGWTAASAKTAALAC